MHNYTPKPRQQSSDVLYRLLSIEQQIARRFVGIRVNTAGKAQLSPAGRQAVPVAAADVARHQHRLQRVALGEMRFITQTIARESISN